jgi:tetratricopeptide (TPR) repeat protein
MYFLKLFTVSVFLIINSNNVFSAGSSSDSNNAKTKSSAYLSAEKLINKKQYSDAIVKLNDALVTDSKNADIFNYLGFSHRKLGKMEDAAFFYNKALEINPKHKGALEYQGEMYLTLNQIGKAEENLKKLDKICFLGCSEFDKLKKSIMDKKSGKKSSY